MIVRLASASDNEYIRLSPEPVRSGQAVTVIGFGDTDPSSRTALADHLHEVELEVVDSQSCRAAYGGAVTEDMICAEGDEVDSCMGDSGGPLLIRGDSMRDDRLVGLVSWGRGCALEGFPGVYTEISFFYDWVVETVCDLWPEDSPEYMGCFDAPTQAPTRSPTRSPTRRPTNSPTPRPTISPEPTVSPTGSPTSSPTITPQPTSSPTESPTNSYPPLEFVAWSPTRRLGQCQGNCYNDGDCVEELVCYDRGNTEFEPSAPGCAENSVVPSGANICVNMTLVAESLFVSLFTVNDDSP